MSVIFVLSLLIVLVQVEDSKAKITGRVNQATQVQLHSESAWMAALTDKNGVQIGAGAYIRPNWFVTSAQNTLKKKSFEIRACLQLDAIACRDSNTRNVEEFQVYRHPKFFIQNGIPHNDIALIYVYEALNITGPPLQLADRDIGGEAQVFSFGFNADHSSVRVLHYAFLTVADHKTCHKRTTPTTICTGDDGTYDIVATPCQGDEGIPLHLLNVLYGIMNRATDNCVNGKGIAYFESIAAHRKWINLLISRKLQD